MLREKEVAEELALDWNRKGSGPESEVWVASFDGLNKKAPLAERLAVEKPDGGKPAGVLVDILMPDCAFIILKF